MEDDDDDDEDFSYSYRGGRRTAEGLFPKVTEPVEAGVKLERSGLFGMVGNLSAQGTGFCLIPSTAWCQVLPKIPTPSKHQRLFAQ
jgi:hypothetical protein